MRRYSYITSLKKLIMNVIPSRFLSIIKKMYYIRLVRPYWERDFEPLNYFVKDGDFVLDIGANVGWYTAILSKLVGNQGKVYSIEPIPETFEILSFIVKNLPLKNVELLNYAISEKDGSAVMEVPLHDYGGPNFYQSRIIADERSYSPFRKYEVRMRSIDSLFFRSSETISFIKCDVEGYELSVVKGAKRFLLKSKPALLIEVIGNPDDDNSNAKELFSQLIAQNYTAYWFDGQKLNKRSFGDKSDNYFFLQPRHLSKLAPLISFEKG